MFYRNWLRRDRAHERSCHVVVWVVCPDSIYDRVGTSVDQQVYSDVYWKCRHHIYALYLRDSRQSHSTTYGRKNRSVHNTLLGYLWYFDVWSTPCSLSAWNLYCFAMGRDELSSWCRVIRAIRRYPLLVYLLVAALLRCFWQPTSIEDHP